MCIITENIRKMWIIQNKAHGGVGGIKKENLFLTAGVEGITLTKKDRLVYNIKSVWVDSRVDKGDRM